MCFNLYLSPLFLSVGTTENSLTSSYSFSLIKELYMLERSPWDFFPQLSSPQTLNPSLHEQCSNTLNIFGALSLASCSSCSKNWTQHSLCHLISAAPQRGKSTSLKLQATYLKLLHIYSGRKKSSHITTWDLLFPVLNSQSSRALSRIEH